MSTKLNPNSILDRSITAIKLSDSYLPLSGGTLTGTLNSHSIIPTATTTYNLGSSSLQFSRTYTRYLDTQSDYNLRLCSGGTEHLNVYNGNVNTTANIIPTVNNTYSLGSSSYKWSNVYATTFTGNLDGTATFAGEPMEDIDIDSIITSESEGGFEYTDLSYIDIYGNALSGRCTANCYVIRNRGVYRFPLVYGNALLHGEDNTSSYTNQGLSNQADFVNYMGNAISSPYIETDTSMAASSIEILWADEANVMDPTSLSLVTDDSGITCAQFEVTNVPINGANALIAIKDSEGVVMWSWHLWFTTDSLIPIVITNSSGADTTIMPVNLGTKYDDNVKTKPKNVFYQWGRKDPMPTSKIYSSNTSTNLFDISSGSWALNSSAYVISTIAPTVQDVIKAPNTFFKYDTSYNNNWVQVPSVFYNFWNADASTINYVNTLVKTIYDPCPVGWVVPKYNIFTGFSISNVVGSFDKGWKFKKNSDDNIGVKFQASGYRLASSGGCNHVGSGGYCWSSGSYSTTYARSLVFSSSAVDPTYAYSRGYGFSVRAAQDLNF